MASSDFLGIMNMEEKKKENLHDANGSKGGKDVVQARYSKVFHSESFYQPRGDR